MAPLSILSLMRVTEESDARGALDNARDLASQRRALPATDFPVGPQEVGGASVHFVTSKRALESLSGRKRPQRQLLMCKSRSVPERAKCDFGGLAETRAGGWEIARIPEMRRFWFDVGGSLDPSRSAPTPGRRWEPEQRLRFR
jgi:hypothetical protein